MRERGRVKGAGAKGKRKEPWARAARGKVRGIVCEGHGVLRIMV